MGRLGAFIVCMVLGISILATPVMGASFTVGDSNGWALGVDYTTWASTKAFKVGDSLVFNYGSSHSVVEVSSSEYASCSLSNPLSAYRSGATTVTLKTPGQHYFVCGAPGHCDGGQKLAIIVSSAETAAPFGSPATASSPTGSIGAPETPAIITRAPTCSENNDVQDSSSARILSPMIATILFMACCLV